MRVLCVGHCSYDIICPVEAYPKEDNKYRIDERIDSGGGSASNAAYLLGKWGVETYMAGVVGSDDFGTKIKKELESVQVKTDNIETIFDQPTSISFVLVNKSNGSRTVFSPSSKSSGQVRKYDYLMNPDVILIDGYEYTGDFKDGCRQGKGVILYKNGDKYDGEWANDKYNGKGIYYFHDGSTYEGGYKDDLKCGKGRYKFASGNKYEGNFENDVFNGDGVFVFADGKKYEGQFKNGKMEGKGTFTMKGGIKYVGDFVNDNFEGHGVLTIKGQGTYDGEFKNGKKNGHGTWTGSDGPKQEGEWADDNFQG